MSWTRVLQHVSADHCVFGIPTFENGENISGDLLLSGKPISFDRLSLPVIRWGHVLPISMAMQVFPVLNEAATAFFAKNLGEDVQLIECAPVNGHNFWIANILPVLDCLDRSNTRAEFYPHNYPTSHLRDRVKFAFELAIYQSKVVEHPIFRIADDPLKLIVTRTFLSALIDLGLLGLTECDLPRYVAV